MRKQRCHGRATGLPLDYDSEDSNDEDDDEEEEDHDESIPQNIWIIKPGEYTNCGFGIQIGSNINEIKGMVNQITGYKKTCII
jgi:hypothetical protein